MEFALQPKHTKANNEPVSTLTHPTEPRLMLNTVNFGFLKQQDPTLQQLAAVMDRYVFTDPNTALIKVRQIAESLAKSVATLMGIPCDSEQSMLNVEKKLRKKGSLDQSLQQVLLSVRLTDNEALHNHVGGMRETFQQLNLVLPRAVWFRKKITRNPNFKVGQLQPPEDPADIDEEFRQELRFRLEEIGKKKSQLQGITLVGQELQRHAEVARRKAAATYANEQAAIGLAADMEGELKRLRTEHLRLISTQTAEKAKQPWEAREEVTIVSRQAFNTVDLEEFDTRRRIDQQLRDTCWGFDTAEFRDSKFELPPNGCNLAVSDWPTSDRGSQDYFLLSGLMPWAAIETKRCRRNVKHAIGQAERYSKYFDMIPAFVLTGDLSGQFRLRFVFSSNGNPDQLQFNDASGVLFCDIRLETSHSRALTGWYSLAGLDDLLVGDTQSAKRNLEVEPSDHLHGHPYQRVRIAAVVDASINGQLEILLAIAIGKRKASTCTCLLDRLFNAKRFRRTQFLVERTRLATRAMDYFTEIKQKNHRSYPEIYDIKGIGDMAAITLRSLSTTRPHPAESRKKSRNAGGAISWAGSIHDGHCRPNDSEFSAGIRTICLRRAGKSSNADANLSPESKTRSAEEFSERATCCRAKLITSGNQQGSNAHDAQ